MKKWFISDTHFSHSNIIRYTGRPFKTAEEMNGCLIKNWNDCIDADDQVFFLGDFGLDDVDLPFALNFNVIRSVSVEIMIAMHMMRVGFSIVLESAFLKIGQHTVEFIHIPSNEKPLHFQLHGHVHEKKPSKIISNQLNL
jgi:calcineurin-like phosphoesterase family protein